MTDIDVRCDPVIDGWHCRVRVADETGASEYDVGIGELGSFLPSILPAPGFEDMDRLVRETFEFLLEREPATSILVSDVMSNNPARSRTARCSAMAMGDQ